MRLALRRAARALFVPGAAALLLGGPVQAQVQRSGGGSGDARLQQQLQQAMTGKASAEAEASRLKQENEAMKKQLADATGQQTALKQRAAALAASARQDEQAKAADAAAKDKLKSQMQELITRFRETAQTLKEVESDRSTLRQTLATTQEQLAANVERNQKLYQLNSEILQQLEHGSNRGNSRVSFVKIARNRLENLVDDYHAKADELHSPAH